MRIYRAFSLIEILVVMVVLMILAAIVMPRLMGGKTLDGKTIKAPKEAAKEVVCRSNLNQVRQGVQIYRIGNEGEPISLSKLQLPSEVTHCAVGGEEYQLSSETGEVHCPHPGHETF